MKNTTSTQRIINCMSTEINIYKDPCSHDRIESLRETAEYFGVTIHINENVRYAIYDNKELLFTLPMHLEL